MWQVREQPVPSGVRTNLLRENAPLSFCELFDLLESDSEFVLIDSPLLASLSPDPTPFAPQFARQQDLDVITFPNLGGDALLVAPASSGATDAYPHLAAFLRKAPEEQIISFWKVTAGVLQRELGDSPRWLSTAGLGVAWLHIRLDTRPKYYSYAPYKVESFQSRLL